MPPRTVNNTQKSINLIINDKFTIDEVATLLMCMVIVGSLQIKYEFKQSIAAATVISDKALNQGGGPLSTAKVLWRAAILDHARITRIDIYLFYRVLRLPRPGPLVVVQDGMARPKPLRSVGTRYQHRTRAAARPQCVSRPSDAAPQKLPPPAGNCFWP